MIFLPMMCLPENWQTTLPPRKNNLFLPMMFLPKNWQTTLRLGKKILAHDDPAKQLALPMMILYRPMGQLLLKHIGDKN